MATDSLAPLSSTSLDVSQGTSMRDLVAGLGSVGVTVDDAARHGLRGTFDAEIALGTGPHRDEIIKRLRRAEGQLRGIVRMLEEGQGCLPISQQLMAVRKALDATMARMTVNYLQQEMADAASRDPEVGRAIERVGLLVGRLG